MLRQVRTLQGGQNRLIIAFHRATETQSRPPDESLFLYNFSVKGGWGTFAPCVRPTLRKSLAAGTLEL